MDNQFRTTMYTPHTYHNLCALGIKVDLAILASLHIQSGFWLDMFISEVYLLALQAFDVVDLLLFGVTQLSLQCSVSKNKPSEYEVYSVIAVIVIA